MSETSLKSAAQAPNPSDPVLLHRLGLAGEVAASRTLLDLDDDWDDRGSPGYAEATWNRAVEFLVRLAWELSDRFELRFGSAEVLPGSQGAIDLEVHVNERRLLVSVPREPGESARYYGHDRSKQHVVKGLLAPEDPNPLLAEWLAG